MKATLFYDLMSRKGVIALALLLNAAFPLSGNAVELWKVNFKKSQFGPGSSTLVLEREKGTVVSEAANGTGNSPSAQFVVITDSRIFVASDDGTATASGTGGVRTVDYAKWKGMKLVKIGENVRVTDICSFSCQSGLLPRRITLRFTSSGIDVKDQMKEVAVLER